jgi:hypothetical protein
MQKYLYLILSILILSGLVGCNLPVSGPSTPSDLSTQVSAFLSSTPPSQVSPTDIPVVSITNTAESSPTLTLTQEPTETSTPETDLSTTPTNTSPDLPEGPSTWSDPFIDGTRFGINPEGYDDGQTKITVSKGEMILTSITGSGWRGWRLTSQKPSNYYLKADFSTEECSESDQYGLVIQSPDYISGLGYYFSLTCDGRYAFQKWDGNGLANIIGWDSDPNINVGPNQNNSMGIKKTGNQYILYVNNTKISEIEDDEFSSPGYFGPFIAGVNTPNFTVRMSNIEYWNLP